MATDEMNTRAAPFLWNPMAKVFTPRKKFADLPLELMDQILNSCSIRTMKAMRLVNHALRTIADRHLFREIYVAILPKSLNNLLHIAEHPTLRLCVGKVILLNQILHDEYLLFSRWYKGSFAGRDWWLNFHVLHAYYKFMSASKSARRRGVHPYPCQQNLTDFLEESGRVISKPAQDIHHRRFVKLYGDQQQLIKCGLGLSKFSRAMSLLTELRCVETYETALGLRRGSMSLQGTHVPFLSDIQRQTHLIDPFDSYNTEPRADRKIEIMLEWLTLALRHESTAFRQISLGSIPQSYWRRGFMDFPGARVGAFGNLRALQLYAEVRFTDTGPGSVSRLQDGLKDFLRSITLIEELDLDFRFHYNTHRSVQKYIFGLEDVHVAGVNGWYCRVPQMSEILDGMIWPKLKKLRFGACGFTKTTFCKLMLQHKHRLRVFEARALELDNSDDISWKTILEDLGPQMFLTNVRIGMLQDLETRSRLLADVRLNKQTGNRRSAVYHRAVSQYLESCSEAKEYPTWGSKE